MPKQTDINKVLVIGSGPIIIGQAAEFDYSGTQACLALREEGMEVVLINNNPATVMTDEACADKVYFEPLTVESVEKVIQKEKPDGLLATLGGQTGLNLAFALDEQDILSKYGVTLLGTPIESIKQGEDRELFRSLMQEIGEPVPESEIVEKEEEALEFAAKTGYPIIIRPAYTLGGGGGGIAHNEEELRYIVTGGLDASPISQCLVEKSIAGFKEVEYEVMRDENDTCITVCNMENIDPVGVHTGDSIVVAPSQTLTDVEYQMLRAASLKVIRALGIVGGCNIQFALDPHSKQYYLIEVNPRVSRSSALASKATGYPIARMAAKLSVGYHLHELLNPVTGHTYASFEPALDYVVVKFPRWPFDKFVHAKRTLGTQMKATGEVMAIERNLESALQKAVRSLEIKTDGLALPELVGHTVSALYKRLDNQDDQRFFVLMELLRKGETAQALHDKTEIDLFFLQSFEKLVRLEEAIKSTTWKNVTQEQLMQWKKTGFTDKWMAKQWETEALSVYQQRKEWGIVPSYHMVDTCAAEFTAETPYYYSSWYQHSDGSEEKSTKPKILILGSGPIRIGQGIEFDYCSVHGAMEVQKAGYEAVIMNNNPETVSTDFEMADHLYFEPLTSEDVLHVADAENVEAVIVQLGGQTGISLTDELEKAGLNVLGTSSDTIDALEDRGRFYEFMNKVGVPHIPGVTGYNKDDVIEKAKQIGFPVLLRPSYVIGGQGMAIHTSEEELTSYLTEMKHNVEYPILIDAFIPGKELEVDVLTDGHDIYIPGIFEHVEPAGVHSGDSIAVTPPFSVQDTTKELLVQYAQNIARGMNFKGIFNIQFVYEDNTLYVIEINPRASRTVPIFSKVTGTHLIEGAVHMLLGKSVKDWADGKSGLVEETPYYTVKAPVFSNDKLAGIDPLLEAEMKSTGELISIAQDKEEAFQKAFAWSETQIPLLFKETGRIFCDIHHSQLDDAASSLKQLENLGYTLVSDDNEWDTAHENMSYENWVEKEDAVAYISFPKTGYSTGAKRRQEALKQRKTVVTNTKTLEIMLEAMTGERKEPKAIEEWLKQAVTAEEGV
ncbi:carbamoyl-phosphate synthase large subunit [Alteribacillus persepolensis]|uniref:Carbamoyl phosphate synthase large chain n=1 Tax=Alteribacillus persepolensis TaxID=568899 RepID=A0A1G8H2R7_9BACI|nr:carbamoyl phosphate synthase large subunit [Alteribacillus persepolensis]SDI00933.1 carbamoyl-phosphate synthase large subunit [Alteribacillus persepolensis]